MTQEALVEKVCSNFSVNSLSRYEAGAVEMGIAVFFKIYSALGIETIDISEMKLNQTEHTPKGYEALTDDRKSIVNQIVSSLLYQQIHQQ